jgi:AhpD family alkylhydroperoxidase
MDQKDIEQVVAKITKEVPELAKSFGGLFVQTMKDGALSVKQKELIALGIAVAQRCELCIRMHVKKCVSAGCQKNEILEAAGVAVLMQGGPAYMYLSCVLDAIENA